MTSETFDAVKPATLKTFETPAADIDLAISSFLNHARNSVQTEISPTLNQIW